MLVIDDNMLKLAKMQETLLKMSIDNRQANLKQYSQTVIEIDRQAFSSLLDELSQVSEHNRTLEDELQFLEQMRCYYEQLYELQLSFKRVCELYGGELQLSDLLQIDIEYIESRISTINGYLINKKNISNNKEKLQSLNEQLVSEEKNSKILSDKLLEFENSLRENFLNAEGRTVVDGQLQYISVVSEYEKLGYDFKVLLYDKNALDEILSKVASERLDVEEKLKTADICYTTNPNSDSKQIFDEINKEFLRVKYRLTMLKILQLLACDYNSYDLFKEKREDLLDLIKYRSGCLETLGMRISIDPFSRTKVFEQLQMISSLGDNSKLINKLKKEIAELSERVDEMIYQNDEYMMTINDTKDLVVSRVGISDIDVSGVSLEFDDVVDFDDEKKVLDNQVVDIRDKSGALNISIVKRKTSNVIKRVNEMVSDFEPLEEKEEVLVPELVIVSQPVEEDKETIEDSEDDKLDLELVIEDKEEKKPSISIFETVEPFVETPLFVDRTDDDVDVSIDLENKNNEDDFLLTLESDMEVKKENSLDLLPQIEESEEEMPEAFWITQTDDKAEENTADVIPSFDEQIDALLSDNEDTKIKKLVA